jgi:hypothetical protein
MTGKPLAGVRVKGRIVSRDVAMRWDIEAVSDEKGRYRLTGFPKTDSYWLGVVPENRTTYLPQVRELNDTESMTPLEADFDLVCGVRLGGRLIDKATGKPVAGTVSYALLPGNARYLDVGRPGGLVERSIAQQQVVKEDGSFEMTVFPGEGVVWANADDGRYLPLIIPPDDEKKGLAPRLGLGSNGRVVIQGHAYCVIDPSKEAQSLTVDLTVIGGRTLTGTVVGPDGEPVAGARGMFAGLARVFSRPAR